MCVGIKLSLYKGVEMEVVVDLYLKWFESDQFKFKFKKEQKLRYGFLKSDWYF